MADMVVCAEDPVVGVASDSEALLNDALSPVALLPLLKEDAGDADAVVFCFGVGFAQCPKAA
jgi:hypothetical protein